MGGVSRQIYGYRFKEGTRRFLEIADRGYGLGCRDIYSYRVLKNAGLNNVFLTGCPAMFDTKYIDTTGLKSEEWDIKKICLSDPANPKHYSQAIGLIHYLRQRFPEAKIRMVFHRGNTKSNGELTEFAKKIKRENVDVVDISGKCAGFMEYDDCDLHIGFRVHAHIYCLSIRRKSVLIEEDGRGAGMDSLLGLPQIKAWNDFFQPRGFLAGKVSKRLKCNINRNLIKEIESYLNILWETEGAYFKNAFSLSKVYYELMNKFIDRLFI